MKVVLITGAYGFLGRSAAQCFKSHGWRVIGLGHGHWGFELAEDFGIDRWLAGDIEFSILETIQENLDCIVHCGGGSSVGYSVQNPLQDFNKTVKASINLLEYIRLYQPQAKFIYPSSAAVYGKKEPVAITEHDALLPVSPYGFHKKIVEELCMSYHANYGLSVTIVRFFSLYGAGLQKQLLWDACNKFFRSSGKVEFYGTGDETRDWLHVNDAVKLMYKVVDGSKDCEIINGGSGVALSIAQILGMVADMFGEEHLVGFNQKSREGDPKHYRADNSMALTKGWQPKVGIEEGLREYVKWHKEQKKN